MKINEIIKDLKNAIKSENLNISDDNLLEQSVKIYITNLIQEKTNTYNNTTMPKKPSQNGCNSEIKDYKVTPKQLNYLKKLGYKGNINISKLEAKKLIEELINKKRVI